MIDKDQRREIFNELKDQFEDDISKNSFIFIENPAGLVRWKNSRMFMMMEQYLSQVRAAGVEMEIMKKERMEIMKNPPVKPPKKYRHLN